MKRHRSAKNRRSGFVLIMYEIVFSGVLLIALSLLSAILLSGMKNPTANIKIFSLAVLLVCAAISGFASSRYNGNALSGIIASAIFVGIMLIISLIAAKGDIGGGIFMNYLCYMLVAAFSAFLGKKRERRRRH